MNQGTKCRPLFTCSRITYVTSSGDNIPRLFVYAHSWSIFNPWPPLVSLPLYVLIVTDLNFERKTWVLMHPSSNGTSEGKWKHEAARSKNRFLPSFSYEKETGTDSHGHFPGNEHYFGLVNFGNTCYCNSVLQALYFCRPFRDKVLEFKAKNKKTNRETLLTCLADLFHNISTQKKKTGTVAPKKFITRLRKENEVFDNYMQQDAHEFFNYLLNTIGDLLSSDNKINQSVSPNNPDNSNKLNHLMNGSANGALFTSTTTTSSNVTGMSGNTTWVHDIFQGTLTNETRCLNCESLSSKDEDFLDLSVDVDQNVSITQCLKDFSNTETLSSEHKYYCENCCSKQEAQKRMRIKKLPMILALHLKRFKYMENQNRHTKLSYRVVFPLELRLFNKSSSSSSKNDPNDDKLYDLVAVVIHCGPGPNRGHYISIVKSFGFWLLFDDDIVDKIDPATIEDFFGLTSDNQKTNESGYILFYQSRDS